MALAALSGEGEDCRTWEALLQHRFDGDGPLAGHAVGNLVLAGLVASTGDQVEALDVAGRLIGAVGAGAAHELRARWRSRAGARPAPEDPGRPTEVVGQVAVATTTAPCRRAPAPAGPPACEEAVQAVLDADWVSSAPARGSPASCRTCSCPGLRDALVGPPPAGWCA
jgi:2-phospho-L-lactate transferase/gluconeogenesis factor (CofD/UPF0052 family)